MAMMIFAKQITTIPVTGDEFRYDILLGLMLLSAIIIIIASVLLIDKKKKRNGKGRKRDNKE